MGVEIVEGLADDADVGADVHEVGVAGPAGYEMHVDVVGQAGTSAAIDVDSDVEAVGFDGFGEYFLCVAGESHHLEHGLFVEIG